MNFSGRIQVQPTLTEDGKASVLISGLRSPIGSVPDLSVTGTNLTPAQTGETRIQQVETNTTIFIGSINAPGTTIIQNQATTNSATDFNNVFRLLEASPLENKNEIKDLIAQFKDSIKSESPEKSRPFFKLIEEKVEGYPAVRDALILAASKVFTEYMTMGS